MFHDWLIFLGELPFYERKGGRVYMEKSGQGERLAGEEKGETMVGIQYKREK